MTEGCTPTDVAFCAKNSVSTMNAEPMDLHAYLLAP